MISNINNVQSLLDEAAGHTLMVELRMRLIAEHSSAVREKVTVLVGAKKSKKLSKNYWDCNLEFLDEAICGLFQEQLTQEELKKMSSFRRLRNKLLHADFVNLLIEMGIQPTGRQILNPCGDERNILTSGNIKEAVLSVSSARTRGLQKITTTAKEIILILDRILRSLALK